MPFCKMVLQVIGRVWARGFGICCAPGAKMWTRGLVYPLFVAQTTCFGMPTVFSVKEKWAEHGVECLKIRDDFNL